MPTTYTSTKGRATIIELDSDWGRTTIRIAPTGATVAAISCIEGCESGEITKYYFPIRIAGREFADSAALLAAWDEPTDEIRQDRSVKTIGELLAEGTLLEGHQRCLRRPHTVR